MNGYRQFTGAIRVSNPNGNVIGGLDGRDLKCGLVDKDCPEMNVEVLSIDVRSDPYHIRNPFPYYRIAMFLGLMTGGLGCG